MFLTLMVVGLVGLGVMAMPILGGRAHAHLSPGAPTVGHAVGAAMGHGAHSIGAAAARGGGGAATSSSLGSRAAGASETLPADAQVGRGRLRLLPSPRAMFSVLALYGAFGNALVHAAHLEVGLAALIALVPALLIEWFLVRPLWSLLFRFQGHPSTPLEELVLAEARAVVPFRNGRGIVSTVRDGRLVQLAARLRDDEASVPVKVGDRLRIEDVDAARERLTVSIDRE